jgi:hypothetical protein
LHAVEALDHPSVGVYQIFNMKIFQHLRVLFEVLDMVLNLLVDLSKNLFEICLRVGRDEKVCREKERKRVDHLLKTW